MDGNVHLKLEYVVSFMHIPTQSKNDFSWTIRPFTKKLIGAIGQDTFRELLHNKNIIFYNVYDLFWNDKNCLLFNWLNVNSDHSTAVAVHSNVKRNYSSFAVGINSLIAML